MRADEAVAATIQDLSHDGRGIADVGGRRVFVAGALPSERVLVRSRKRRRKYQEAELVDIVEPATSRVEPACPYFGRCGGCALQHIEYAAQVRFKQKVVADAFETIARLTPDRWEQPITGARQGYRRRARLGCKYVAGKDRVLVGFRERAAPYVTDMSHCLVLAPPMDTAIGDLADAIGRTAIRDRIPQAEISIGDDAGAVVLRVLDAPSAADRDVLLEFGERIGIDVYLQPSGPASIHALTDRPRRLSYRLDDFGVTIEFEPLDFIQINAEINVAMVRAAVAAAELRPSDRVLDLYCGLGNFTLPIARSAAYVLGVDGDGGLIARGARNAEHNGIGNARFVSADLSASDYGFFADGWDVVFIDPARAGAESAVASMAQMRPRRIVYVSCHPGTLARDAAVLVREQGYVLSSVRVLDMFPHTHHVEAISVFDRARD